MAAKELYRSKVDLHHNGKHYPLNKAGIGKAFDGSEEDILDLLERGLIEEGRGHNEPSKMDRNYRQPKALKNADARDADARTKVEAS